MDILVQSLTVVSQCIGWLVRFLEISLAVVFAAAIAAALIGNAVGRHKRKP